MFMQLVKFTALYIIKINNHRKTYKTPYFLCFGIKFPSYSALPTFRDV